MYAKPALEPKNGAPCSGGPNFWREGGREGGFKGNIAKPATVAICCANHCADYGGQSFTYTNQPVDRNPSPERTTDAAGHAAAAASQDATLNWIVHPGTFAIASRECRPPLFGHVHTWPCTNDATTRRQTLASRAPSSRPRSPRATTTSAAPTAGAPASSSLPRERGQRKAARATRSTPTTTAPGTRWHPMGGRTRRAATPTSPT